MNDLLRTLESGDKTIDGVVEGRAYPEDVRSGAWSERTESRNNEIPSAPPYKAKVYNLNSLTCDEFRQFLIDAEISVLQLDEHNGYFVEVETPNDLAFIVSLDGEYYDENHGEDDPPIKVRVLYNDSKHNYHTSLIEFTRDMLQGAGVGGATSANAVADGGGFGQIRTDSRNTGGLLGFSRNEMGVGLQEKKGGDGVLLSRTGFSTQQAASAQPQTLNLRASAPAGDKPADLALIRTPAANVTGTELNFRDKEKDSGLHGRPDLSSIRKGTDGGYSFRSSQQRAQTQDRPVPARKPYSRKVVDAEGWVSNT